MNAVEGLRALRQSPARTHGERIQPAKTRQRNEMRVPCPLIKALEWSACSSCRGLSQPLGLAARLRRRMPVLMEKVRGQASLEPERDIIAEATRHLQGFVAVVQELALARAVNFDLLVSGGNTGLVMMYITERIYNHLGVHVPPKLALPIFRYAPGFLDNPAYLHDNSALQEDVESCLLGSPRLRNVLFVDDEIRAGITALTILRLLRAWQRLHQGGVPIEYYIVAENQGFNARNSLPDASLRFFPYAAQKENWNNVIACLVPQEFEEPIKKVFPDQVLMFHHRMNILLGLPLKEFNGGKPRFGYEVHDEVAARVSELPALQKGFREFLDQKIAACFRV
jgi:hypothetical protein